MPAVILQGRKGNPAAPFLPGFREDFNQSNGALIATANGRQWITTEAPTAPPRADIVRQNGAAVVTVPNGAEGNVMKHVDGRSSDGVAVAVVRSKGNQAGSFIVRGSSLLNCIEVGLREASNNLRPALFLRLNGGRTPLGAAPAGTVVNDGSRFETVLDGPAITVFLDGTPIIAARETTHQTLTGYGLYGYASGAGIAWESLDFFAA
ncbi:MAG: hypothetical protein K0R01_146 [Mycobacterium sp.]|jgi:hypothetical protein|nr:hypothetical protein [Mycobacterium sp.]